MGPGQLRPQQWELLVDPISLGKVCLSKILSVHAALNGFELVPLHPAPGIQLAERERVRGEGKRFVIISTT